MKRHLTGSVVLLLAACTGSTLPPSNPRGGPADIISTSTGVIVRLEDDVMGTATLIDADPEAVWQALPETFESLGIEAGVLDEREMTYGTHRFTGSRIGDRRTSSFVRCGGTASGPSMASGYRIRLLISSRVEGQADGRSMLITAVSGAATTVEGTSTAASRCVSGGELEALIASVASRLATRP